MPMHPDFQKIYSQFVMRYGDKEGKDRYYAWLNSRKLDDTKPYSNSQIQKNAKCQQCTKRLCESLDAFKPLVKLLKNDTTGKTYEIEAHFALPSMNNVLYTREEMRQASTSMMNKRVDLNHRFPPAYGKEWLIKGADILAASACSRQLETCSGGFKSIDWLACLVHVNNGTVDAKGRDVQEAIKSGVYHAVSAESHANGEAIDSSGNRVPIGMEYDGLAFLDEEALPGFPLTRITPLEAVMEQIFESLDNKSAQEVTNRMEENLSNNQSASQEAFPPKPNQPTGQAPPQQAPPQQAPPQQQPPAKPAQSAAFCPLCGTQLQDGMCMNQSCPAYGKKINLQSLEEVAKELMLKAQASEARAKAVETESNLKVAKLERQNAEQMTECNTLKEETTDLRTRLTKAESLAKDSANSLKIAERRVKDRDSTIETLKIDLDRKDEAFAISEAAREDAIGAKHRAEAEQAKSERTANEERRKRAEIQAEMSSLREQNADIIKREGETADNQARLSERLVDTEKRLTEANSKLGSMATKLTELQHKNSDLEEKLTTAKTQYDSSIAKTNSDHLAELATIKGKMEADSKAATDKLIAEHKEAIDKQAKEYNDKLEAIQADIKKLTEKAMRESKEASKYLNLLHEKGIYLIDGKGNIQV